MDNLPVYCTTQEFLDFDEWCDKFSELIDIELSAIGADRELDFEPEQEYEIRYETYLNNQQSKEV